MFSFFVSYDSLPEKCVLFVCQRSFFSGGGGVNHGVPLCCSLVVRLGRVAHASHKQHGMRNYGYSV